MSPLTRSAGGRPLDQLEGACEECHEMLPLVSPILVQPYEPIVRLLVFFSGKVPLRLGTSM